MANFNQVTVTNTNTGKVAKADVLQHSDKALKVVLVGTTLTIFLKRTDVNKVYIGNVGAMEFTSTGEIL